MRTIIHTLGPSDRLAVVQFNQEAKTTFDLTAMDPDGQATAGQDRWRPDGYGADEAAVIANSSLHDAETTWRDIAHCLGVGQNLDQIGTNFGQSCATLANMGPQFATIGPTTANLAKVGSIDRVRPDLVIVFPILAHSGWTLAKISRSSRTFRPTQICAAFDQNWLFVQNRDRPDFDRRMPNFG